MIPTILRDVTTWFYVSLGKVIPELVTASIIVILGYVIARVIEKLIKKILKGVELNKWMEERDFKEALFDIDFEESIAEAFKWYILIIFLREASRKVGMQSLSSIISQILVLIPNWAIGAGMLAVFLIVADKVSDKVKSTGVVFSSLVGDISYGVTIFFGLVLALPKFGFKNVSVLVDSFKILIGGFSAGLALALGIGFGSAIKEGPAKDLFKEE